MTQAIIIYACMAAIGILAPIILLIIWQKKTKKSIRPAIMGAAMFFVFAIVLESIPKMILLNPNTALGQSIINHTWDYIIIGALLAGLFEETGRLVAFKYLLKNNTDRQTAISSGIGHGGFEVMFTMGVGGFLYLVYSIFIQAGLYDQLVGAMASSNPEQAAMLNTLPATLASTSFLTLAYSVLERVSAVFIHIACSILVFKAVRCKGNMWLYSLAIVLHTVVDMIAVSYQVGIITNLFVVELIILLWAISFFMIVYKKVYKKLPEIVE